MMAMDTLIDLAQVANRLNATTDETPAPRCLWTM